VLPPGSQAGSCQSSLTWDYGKSLTASRGWSRISAGKLRWGAGQLPAGVTHLALISAAYNLDRALAGP
jgi:hypothetical protein